MRETMPRDDSVTAPQLSDDVEQTQRVAESVLRATSARYNEELPWAEPEAIETYLAFMRTNRMNRIASGRLIDRLDLGVSMTGARFTLLLTLYFSRDNLLAQNEISRELSVSRTNITNLIDGLERDGLVARVPNPADRRVSYAQLTQAGEEICIKLLPDMTRLMLEPLQGFSDDEIALFKEFLYRMQRNIIAKHPGKYAKGLGVDA